MICGTRIMALVRLIDWLTDSLTHSLTVWLTDLLTYLLIPSDKHNLIMAIATALISSLFNVTSSQDMPFRQLQQLQCLYHGSSELTFVLLCAPLPRRWWFVVHALWLWCKTRASRALLTLFLTWNIAQHLWTARSKTRHSNTPWSSYTPTFKSINVPLTIKHSIFL